MITVNCKDIESVKSALAVYVSDQVAAVPALKLHEFMLAPINDNEKIDPNQVVKSIRNFLNSIGEEKNFTIIRKNDLISVISINGKMLERGESVPSDQFFTCTHCGYVTRYETIHNNHIKIHYLL